MSSIATAYFCEEEALQLLTQLFARSLQTKPEEKKIIEFMREVAQAPHRLHYDLLIIKGLSNLLKTPYCTHEVAIALLRESLKSISRDTTLLIQVKRVEWTPAANRQITIDDIPFTVSSLDIQATLRLQREHKLKNFVKARI